ncbi:MAG: YggU family protein [Proteobacteria bacterium]|nr:YggU family protein [Pseudomonadota bacterium]
MPFLSKLIDGTVLIRLHVQPKASKTRITGLFDGCLKLAILAPPVDGKANEEVVKFLASTLAIPGRDIILKSGTKGRRKKILVSGLTEEEVRRKLSLKLVVDP